MSFSLFLALPAPLKVVVILVGGLFYMKVTDVAALPAPAPPQEARIVPAEKPAKVIEAIPVKPVKALGPMMVIVNLDGSYNVGRDKLTEDQLFKKLKAMATVNPKAEVMFKADALTPYQMVFSAVKISKKAGLNNVSFAAKPDKR